MLFPWIWTVDFEFISPPQFFIYLFSFQIPFVITEGGTWPIQAFVMVNMEGSKHPLPLTTVHHHLQPVQPSPFTFLQAIFGFGCPVSFFIFNIFSSFWVDGHYQPPIIFFIESLFVILLVDIVSPQSFRFWLLLKNELMGIIFRILCCQLFFWIYCYFDEETCLLFENTFWLPSNKSCFFFWKVGILDEEKILPVEKVVTAIGICSLNDGVPEIRSSKEIPYFL